MHIIKDWWVMLMAGLDSLLRQDDKATTTAFKPPADDVKRLSYHDRCSADRAYQRHLNPLCSKEVFQLRVFYRGWAVTHALNTPARKDELATVDTIPKLPYLYRKATRNAVPYTVFRYRFIVMGHSVRRSLYVKLSVDE